MKRERVSATGTITWPRRCARAGVRASIAAGLVLVVLSACGVSSESDPRALPSEARSKLESPEPARTESAATRFLDLWFVDNAVLVRVDRPVDGPMTAEDKLEALEAGPTQAELDLGLRTAVNSVVPDEPLVATANSLGLTVPHEETQSVVVLTEEFNSLPSQEQLLVLGQVVLTLATDPDHSVLFVDSTGTPLGVPLPDGRFVNRAVSARDFRTLQQ